MLRHSFNGIPVLTNSYRADKYAPHFGEDYALSFRTAIIAKADGTVCKVKGDERRSWIANTPSDPFKPKGFPIIKRGLIENDYGNFVKIDHGLNAEGKRVYTLYAHLDEVFVHVGQVVSEGQFIGYSDSKGNSTGNHIHEEIRVNDIVVDPNKFDYSFKGKGGVEAEIHNKDDSVVITVPTLYVRQGPSTRYSLAGIKELHETQTVEVNGYMEGEDYKDNKWWYRSKLGNFFWAGGTNKPDPTSLITEDKKTMTKEQNEARKAELEALRGRLEARKKELEDAMVVNTTEFEDYTKQWEAFAAEPVEDEVVVAPEVVAEPVVEAPVAEEVKVEEAPVVDAEKEEAKKTLGELETLVSNLKAKFGL